MLTLWCSEVSQVNQLAVWIINLIFMQQPFILYKEYHYYLWGVKRTHNTIFNWFSCSNVFGSQKTKFFVFVHFFSVWSENQEQLLFSSFTIGNQKFPPRNLLSSVLVDYSYFFFVFREKGQQNVGEGWLIGVLVIGLDLFILGKCYLMSTQGQRWIVWIWVQRSFSAIRIRWSWNKTADWILVLLRGLGVNQGFGVSFLVYNSSGENSIDEDQRILGSERAYWISILMSW